MKKIFLLKLLIKIYETETGSVATTDLTTTSFNAGVSEIAQKVEDEGKCRFAVIPDGIVEVEEDDYEENDMDEA